jgi:hypothetical protein
MCEGRAYPAALELVVKLYSIMHQLSDLHCTQSPFFHFYLDFPATYVQAFELQ